MLTLRLAGNLRFSGRGQGIVEPDGCMVRKRPLTTTREKIKGQRARTVHSAHGLAPARKRSFLSGKEYFLDRCPLMGTSLYLRQYPEVEDYELKWRIDTLQPECGPCAQSAALAWAWIVNLFSSQTQTRSFEYRPKIFEFVKKMPDIIGCSFDAMRMQVGKLRIIAVAFKCLF